MNNLSRNLKIRCNTSDRNKRVIVKALKTVKDTKAIKVHFERVFYSPHSEVHSKKKKKKRKVKKAKRPKEEK